MSGALGILLVVIGAIALVALLVVGAFLARREYERRTLVKLFSKREEVGKLGRALEGVLVRLSEAEPEEVELFANDPDSVERHVLHETAQQARLLADELDIMPMPERLLTVVQSLADAAWVIGEQASRVGDETRGVEAIEQLAGVDLESVALRFAAARAQVEAACAACEMEDPSVYGGGLYL
jgi:hypothetical protein